MHIMLRTCTVHVPVGCTDCDAFSKARRRQYQSYEIFTSHSRNSGAELGIARDLSVLAIKVRSACGVFQLLLDPLVAGRWSWGCNASKGCGCSVIALLVFRAVLLLPMAINTVLRPFLTPLFPRRVY
jgi:hypothetical protein